MSADCVCNHKIYQHGEDGCRGFSYKHQLCECPKTPTQLFYDTRAQLAASEAARERAVRSGQILLNSRGCLTNGEPEIPEEISAQFDMLLSEAKFVAAALAPTEPR